LNLRAKSSKAAAVDNTGASPAAAPSVIGKSKKTGTLITFKPDGTIFTITIEFKFELLANRLRELAFLNPGIEIEQMIAAARPGGASRVVDRPTWIRWLNKKTTWFLTGQFFWSHVQGGTDDLRGSILTASRNPYFTPTNPELFPDALISNQGRGRWDKGQYAGITERVQNSSFLGVNDDGFGDVSFVEPTWVGGGFRSIASSTGQPTVSVHRAARRLSQVRTPGVSRPPGAVRRRSPGAGQRRPDGPSGGNNGSGTLPPLSMAYRLSQPPKLLTK
jgi:hypothetical protein